MAADPLLEWIKGPEAYFATVEELDQWKREVVSPQDAQKFIDEYFRKRGEQFKKDLNTRIEFADTKFALTKIPGSRTAMGRAFIILGPPTEQKMNRGGLTAASGTGIGDNPLNNRMQDSAVERGSKIIYTWVYKTDRLPQELGMPELKIDFNTDTARGQQFIENPGLVEPYLRRAAAHFSTKYAMATTTTRSTASVPVPSPSTPRSVTSDPLWNVTPALNGVIYTGDSFVSPRETPFYAVNFFVPKEAATLKEWKSGLLVSLIRDASGTQVVSERQQVELKQYDLEGNRYVDRSFALAPGKYEGMFVLYSPDGVTMLSSHRESFEVAPTTATRASKLLLTSRIDTLETQDALDPFTFVAQKYAIRGDRRFTSKDKIALFTVVENATGPEPQLMQKLTFTKDGKPSFKIPLGPAQVTQTGPHSYLVGLAFDPGTFKPGHYTVELQVRDFNAPEGSELRSKGYVLNTEFDVVQ